MVIKVSPKLVTIILTRLVVIVGDGKERKMLETFAMHNNLQTKVIFRGNLSYVDTQKEYLKADGTIGVSVKPKFPRSWEKVEEAEIPKRKVLNKQNNESDGEFITIEDDGELPF